MIRSRWSISFLGNLRLGKLCILLSLRQSLGFCLLPKHGASAGVCRKRKPILRAKAILFSTERIPAVDPDQPRFRRRILPSGLLQIEQEYPTAASQSFAHAVDLAPNNLDARLRLGELLVSSTQYAEARQQAEAVLQRDGKNAGAHRLLGEVSLHQMQYVSAENELQEAIVLDPRDPQTYEALGLAQLLDAEFGAAEKSFQTAVDLKPDDPQTYINLASFYKGQNAADRAEQVLQQGMARDPKAVELPIALAGLYVERNREADAKRVLDQVEGDAADYPDGRRAVANFYLDNGDATSALDRFRALVSQNENDQAAAKKVAECYLQLSAGRMPSNGSISTTRMAKTPTSDCCGRGAIWERFAFAKPRPNWKG